MNKTILNFLFPAYKGLSGNVALALAGLRVFFGLMLAYHGLQKIMGFSEMSQAFPDLLHIGSAATLSVVIFGEFVCSICFVLGFLTRLAALPMIITMAVAFFVAHGGSVAQGELAFAYMFAFILLWIAGSGKYSIDSIISAKLSR